MKTVTFNRKAKYNYHLIDTWEAGIKLIGIEVKALRQGNISIAEAWVKIKENQVALVGANITPSNKVPDWLKYNPNRERTLLLHKREIKKLSNAVQKGFTIIPLKVYFNSRNLAKIQIATAKGKKKYDKRETIQKRDAKRYGY
jgi:SsrA-binding protein